MASDKSDLLQGTLELLILKALSHGPQHGWGIAQRILQLSGEVLEVNQGSLYPALHRLERRKSISAQWGTSDNNRRARYYQLTAAGRRRLAEEVSAWRRIADAITLLIESPVRDGV